MQIKTTITPPSEHQYNVDAYKRLCTLSHEVKDPFVEWFNVSYQAFISQELNTGDDLIKMIAFAYSWMPTMAKMKNKVKVDWDGLPSCSEANWRS